MYYHNNEYIISTSDKHDAAARERQAKANEKRTSLYEQTRKIENAKKKYNEFVAESKKFLMVEGLNRMLEHCLPSQTDAELKAYGKSIVNNFVCEENVDMLLSGFKTRSLALSEFASIIECTHKEVTKKCDVTDMDSLIVRKSDLDAFYSKIDKASDSETTKVIADRIAKAEEEFVTKNIEDKKKLEDLATQAQEKINNVKEKDTDTENAIKQEYANLYKANAAKLRNRKKGILESIVLRASKAIATDDSIRNNFINESGRLEMDRIIEMAEVMYTFLEMVNTMNIKRVDEKYISSVLESVK